MQLRRHQEIQRKPSQEPPRSKDILPQHHHHFDFFWCFGGRGPGLDVEEDFIAPCSLGLAIFSGGIKLGLVPIPVLVFPPSLAARHAGYGADAGGDVSGGDGLVYAHIVAEDRLGHAECQMLCPTHAEPQLHQRLHTKAHVMSPLRDRSRPCQAPGLVRTPREGDIFLLDGILSGAGLALRPSRSSSHSPASPERSLDPKPCPEKHTHSVSRRHSPAHLRIDPGRSWN